MLKSVEQGRELHPSQTQSSGQCWDFSGTGTGAASESDAERWSVLGQFRHLDFCSGPERWWAKISEGEKKHDLNTLEFAYTVKHKLLTLSYLDLDFAIRVA